MQSLLLLLTPAVAAAAANAAQQVAAFVQHSMQAIRDPTNAADVAAVGELTAFDALERMQHVMLADRVGRAILQNKPLVDDELLQRACSLPSHTFGYRYASFMTRNGFLPSARTPAMYIADKDLRYVMTRYRQCHDFLHTCLECGRTVDEEVAVKLVEWQHTGLPLGLLSVLGGAPHMTSAQRARVPLYYRWASENAPTSTHDAPRRVRMFLTVPWEALLSKSVAEVHAYTGLTPLPRYVVEHTARVQAAAMARARVVDTPIVLHE